MPPNGASGKNQCHFVVSGSLQFQESCNNFGQFFRIVLMHHVSRVIDDYTAMISNGVVALLFVGSPRLPALLSLDDKHGTFDAKKEFQSLRGVKRLRRVGAV